jgi:DNA-binding NarL/FixJ family response regulator
MTDRLRIILVDDHDVVRAGMRAILDSSFDIVGEADNVDSAIELIRERLPDLVVLDVKLPGGGGATVIPAVRRDFPDIRFMALTVSTGRPMSGPARFHLTSPPTCSTSTRRSRRTPRSPA